MSHLINLSIEDCNTISKLDEMILELQSDSEADEEELQPYRNVLSTIMIQASADGWEGP